MKKKLFFAIDSLDVAGAEKSLITLLSLLDYNKYEVDLQLFSYGNELERLLPKEVNLLPPLSYTMFSQSDLITSIKQSFKKREFNMLSSRFHYSFSIRRKNYRNSQKARIYWQSASKVIEKNQKNYDVAISYAQGIPTFFVAEKVCARKKVAWVNVSYRLNKKEKSFQSKYYNSYEKIISVSKSTKEVFLETFPQYAKKLGVIYDINHPEVIFDMSNLEVGFNDGFNGLKILTIGRLARQKGYDIALDACERLRNCGLDFKWYVLGKGPLRKEIEEEIKIRNLSKHFILLGVEANPYPFIKEADIYVQTSRFEGFGLAIAEARILNTPVVTTEFDAVYNQMKQEKNGIVVEMDGESVFQGIMRYINHPSFKEDIVNYLKAEKKGNVEEINKFYDLIS